MPAPPDPLLAALRAPRGLAQVPAREWYPLLMAARRTGLIGTLAARAEAAGVLERLLPSARDALIAGRQGADQYETMLRWETNRVRRALMDCGEPAILLKGAAYEILGLPSSRGRLTGDIDILVRRPALDVVEASLRAHGWQPTELDAYDQRYYRHYMHELPPLQHGGRGTVVDVHHTIAPPTSRIAIAGEMLWPGARPTGISGLFTLAPADMTLHAIIHLFHEGNIGAGLRDLVDIDGLLRHFGAVPGFWDELLARAREFSAGRILFYGLRYPEMLLDTPIPEAVRNAAAQWAPARPFVGLMDWLVLRALLRHRGRAGARLADRLLYVRSHWRRMPPLMLARHLTRKLIVRGQQG